VSTQLLRRDEPIPRGAKIELRVTSFYTIEVDDELLDADEKEVTLEQIESRLGKTRASVTLAVENNYDRADYDHGWFLPPVGPDYHDYEFETENAKSRGGPRRSENYVSIADALARVPA